MRCPTCGSPTQVIATTGTDKDEVSRSRACLENPQHRFTTIEVRMFADRRLTGVADRVQKGVDIIKGGQLQASWLDTLAQLNKENLT